VAYCEDDPQSDRRDEEHSEHERVAAAPSAGRSKLPTRGTGTAARRTGAEEAAQRGPKIANDLHRRHRRAAGADEFDGRQRGHDRVAMATRPMAISGGARDRKSKPVPAQIVVLLGRAHRSTGKVVGCHVRHSLVF